MTTPLRVYLSGPMTGLPDFNRPAFHAAAARLRLAGHQPINPAESDDVLTALLGSPTWHDFIGHAVCAMAQAQAIAYLPNWESSFGARIEAVVAEKMQLPVIDLATMQAVGPTRPCVYELRVQTSECYYNLGLFPSLATALAHVHQHDGSNEADGGPLYEFGDCGEEIEIYRHHLGVTTQDGSGGELAARLRRDWRAGETDDSVWFTEWLLPNASHQGPASAGPAA